MGLPSGVCNIGFRSDACFPKNYAHELRRIRGCKDISCKVVADQCLIGILSTQLSIPRCPLPSNKLYRKRNHLDRIHSSRNGNGVGPSSNQGAPDDEIPRRSSADDLLAYVFNSEKPASLVSFEDLVVDTSEECRRLFQWEASQIVSFGPRCPLFPTRGKA